MTLVMQSHVPLALGVLVAQGSASPGYGSRAGIAGMLYCPNAMAPVLHTLMLWWEPGMAHHQQQGKTLLTASGLYQLSHLPGMVDELADVLLALYS